MNSVRPALWVTVLISALNAHAQLQVYRTYKDFQENSPQTYGQVEFKNWKEDQNTVLIFKGGKEDVELACAKIWGFSYGDHLFRVSNPRCRGSAIRAIATLLLLLPTADARVCR